MLSVKEVILKNNPESLRENTIINMWNKFTETGRLPFNMFPNKELAINNIKFNLLYNESDDCFIKDIDEISIKDQIDLFVYFENLRYKSNLKYGKIDYKAANHYDLNDTETLKMFNEHFVNDYDLDNEEEKADLVKYLQKYIPENINRYFGQITKIENNIIYFEF